MVKSIIENNKSILDQADQHPPPPPATTAQEEAIVETSLRLTREVFALAGQTAKIMNGSVPHERLKYYTVNEFMEQLQNLLHENKNYFLL